MSHDMVWDDGAADSGLSDVARNMLIIKSKLYGTGATPADPPASECHDD